MKKLLLLLLLLLALTTIQFANAQVVSTLAGSPWGYIDGTGTAAQFNFPKGVCTDATGNVYVADLGNHRIRKITPAGVVTTFAGSGVSGYLDGTGTAAQFYSPNGVCTDAAGNVYVVDSLNYRIRKITPAGVVTTFAGSGTEGYIDGTGTAAQFYSPIGVCTDAAGNVYVSDGNIRKITPAGVVTTFAGSGTFGVYIDGTGTAASFYAPRGVCTDAAGNVYVADNNKIRKITPTGVVTTLAGSTTAGYLDGTGTAAQFNSTDGVCADAAGNVYVTDFGNYRIRKITPAGVVTTFAGSGTIGYVDGTGTAAQFSTFDGVCIDSAGKIYIADTDFNIIRKITSAGVVTTFAGSTYGYLNGTGTAAQFNSPSGICTNATGNVYVADKGNSRIRKITSAGVVTSFAGSGNAGYVDGTASVAQFYYPKGVCTDAAGNVYVADGNNRIRKITPAGIVSTLAGSGTGGYADGTATAAQFNSPGGVCTDAAGNVYVADSGNKRIRKITPTGVVTTFAGSGNAGYVDGTASQAQFYAPDGVCTDAVGNVYVTDNHKIRKITPAGLVTTLAGSTYGYADGTATAAQFNSPRGVCTDAAGNVYVADHGNNRIRKITPAGMVSTFAGSGTSGYVDGTGTTAQFYNPKGVCTDAAGNIYVADDGDNRIRKITGGLLGINQNTTANGYVTVYPNPTQNTFHIDFEKEFTGTISDNTGKSLLNVNTKDIDVSSLRPGIYLLDIISEGKRYSKKLIKQ